MKIWICIPVFNRVDFTITCLDSLYRQTYGEWGLIVCDHGSTDGTSQILKERYPNILLLQASSELWWTGAINRCIQYTLKAGDTEHDAVLTLNNDLVVEADYLSVLVDVAERYPNAVVASAGYDIKTGNLVAPGSRQNWFTSKASLIDPLHDCLPEDHDLAELTHAPGRGTLIPLRAYASLGLYDEEHLPHYGADDDFTHRARRAGYRILISYKAKVFIHTDVTGMTVVRRNFGLKGLFRYLTDIKSPAKLSARWWFAIRNCPPVLLPSYLILDFIFVMGSYFKYHILAATRGGWRKYMPFND